MMKQLFRPLASSLYSALLIAPLLLSCSLTNAQVAIKAKTIYTMTTPGQAPLLDGVIIITDGKIAAIGPAASTPVPQGYKLITGAVATPGLIDARGTVGVSGILNQRQDQDQLERSAPVQPELRAIDAYNPNDPLVAWVRSLGVTTIHTGHAPGELISGQTCIVKTAPGTIDQNVLVETATVAATLGPWGQRAGNAAPGTRAKMVAMLREELTAAREYDKKGGQVPLPGSPESEQKTPPARNLRTETLVRVLKKQVPLMVTANNAQDIASALRLAKEFEFDLILDSASESYLMIPELKAAGTPVIIHPTMFRMFGEMQNMSLETCGKLINAGINVSMQSGFEVYVPKTRVVLFEAAIAAANGCTFEQALATITTQPAKLFKIDDRVGSLRIGLDGDVAVFDGDPFEYTTHCTATIINGQIYPGR